jgi:hypothetical protein
VGVALPCRRPGLPWLIFIKVRMCVFSLGVFWQVDADARALRAPVQIRYAEAALAKRRETYKNVFL